MKFLTTCQYKVTFRPELDKRANVVFLGKVVRKDLARKVKAGANVPVFVLEYLLGKYCATDDEAAVAVGVRVVNDTLANNYVRPDEATKAQSLVRHKGCYTFIDKIKVRYSSEEDKYRAELVNFGHRNVHIPETFVQRIESSLNGWHLGPDRSPAGRSARVVEEAARYRREYSSFSTHLRPRRHPAY